ncbi:DNA repair protein RecN [Mediterraneibacter glycyrrhizinilyticus]|uniref:DNA repair protein RecN n=1 Tax=Mediterraneibacter glycyrrhizinilyticus TaxID=342942 RepID=UPI0025A3978F|nr:DNA repair protein RecN [Mediterraneibacter glycyrrhizinilyticus]MDM8125322.1 DNA repair protein RecN [Mediterraneibacter glycyrrhizinilyticus]
MLQNLHVKNLALIDETEVDFGPGLNILTGETGAGKSILMGSVGLALGGRYSADMLRNGASSGLVELTFTVEDGRIRDKLKSMDIVPEDDMITLSRRLMEGRSISRINGETVSMGTLREAASLLIDIHGQHDNQTLLNRKNHLALLDLFSGKEIDPVKERMAEVYHTYQKLKRQLEEASLDDESKRRELSLAEFEVNEIEEATLTEGEDDELEQLYRRMTESRKVTEAIAGTYQHTAEDSSANASDCLSRAIRAFQEISDFDDSASQLYSQLLDADSLLNDFNRELSEYAKSFEFSEEEFNETEERLNLINHLKAKYGKTVSDILAYCERKKQRIEELNDYDTFMQELEAKLKEAKAETDEVSETLHGIRAQYAGIFSEEIKKQMQELNFMDTRLEIRLVDTGRCSANGRDEAEFYIALNPGEPLRPLADIASGGELSRIMLAIKTVLADEEDTPTLIFDEIDAGISGITADKVGEKLHLIGKSRQVICITHLPQIAAAADVHFLIEKNAEDNSVKTRIERLDQDSSVRELARILGGSKVTDSILKSAKEMKELAMGER